MSDARVAESDLGVATELTSFQRNVLTVLAEEPRYGLAIKRELEAYYDEEVNHGRLYPNLDELVEAGLVEKSERDKRTNEYGLTDDGFDALFEQLSWTFSKVATDERRTDRLQELLDDHE